MKLFIILSLIACSYGEKLDRTYLPPESASTAGGSPGILTAPGSQSGPGFSNVPSSFVQPIGASFGQPSGTVSGTGQSPGATFSQTPGSSVGQTSGAPFGQASGSTYGQGPSLTGSQSGSLQPGQSGIGLQTYNQAGVSPQVGRPGLGQGSAGLSQEPNFGSQAQGEGVYSGQPQPERARASIDRNAEILRYENQNDGNTYSYSFETSNGISAEESGVATNGVRAQGAFAYTGDDGQRYSVVYTADENGYQPRGDHLPTPPPIPDEILKSLEENARAAAAGTQEGAYNPNEDLGVAGGPQQNSNAYSGQGQPGQIGAGYQPGRDTQGGVGNAQINYQNQGQTSQYNVPSSSSLVQTLPGSQTSQATNAPYGGSNTPGSINTAISVSQSGQPSGAQFGTTVSSSSFPTTSGVQGSKSFASSYGTSTSSPSVSVMPGNQVFNKDSGYQYNTPFSSPGRFGPQISIGQNPGTQYNTPSLSSSSGALGSQDFSFKNRLSTQSQNSALSGSPGTTRPGFQSQALFGSTGLAPDASRPNQYTTSYGAPGGTTQNVDTSGNRLSSQGNQQSGYNYNSPGRTSPVGSLGSQNYPGSQNNPSPNNQVPVSQYGAPVKSPSGTGSLNSPATSSSGTQGQPQGQSQYGGPVSAQSNSFRPIDSQRLPITSNQASQYPSSPSSTNSGVPTQSSSILKQRPQLGSSGATGSRFQVQVGQEQGDGYQYKRPQNQFIQPGQTGTAFPGPSGTGPSAGSSSPLGSSNQGSIGPSQYFTTLSPTQGSKFDLSGYKYTTSGPTASGPATSSNKLGYSKPSGSAGQGYSSGPNTSGSSDSSAVNIGQGSGYSRPGQYSPSGTTSSSTGTDFSRPGSFTSQYKPDQSSGIKSSLGGSGYQYNNPGSSLGPSSGSPQSALNSQSNFGSGSTGQNKFGAEGSQSGFGPSRQDKPSQTVSQTGYGPSIQDRPGQTNSQPGFNPSRQEGPAENFGGPRQPPSFSAEEGYKY